MATTEIASIVTDAVFNPIIQGAGIHLATCCMVGGRVPRKLLAESSLTNGNKSRPARDRKTYGSTSAITAIYI